MFRPRKTNCEVKNGHLTNPLNSQLGLWMTPSNTMLACRNATDDIDTYMLGTKFGINFPSYYPISVRTQSHKLSPPIS